MLKLAKTFAEHSQRYDRVWKVVREGLTAKEAGFNVLKQGEYVGSQTPNMRMRQHGNQHGHAHFDQNQKGRRPGPDMPHPNVKRTKDLDLEMELNRGFRARPKPF